MGGVVEGGVRRRGDLGRGAVGVDGDERAVAVYLSAHTAVTCAA